MMSFGTRLDSFKKQVIQYIEDKVRNERAFRNNPGDLFMSGNEVYIQDNHVGRYKLCTCAVERLCIIADKIHFRPLESLPKKEINIVKTKDMNFEIQKDVPLPARFAEKIGDKDKVVTTKNGRINYGNLPLRAMQKGECIVLFDNITDRAKLSSRKGTAVTGIRRITHIMGMADKFHVDIVGDNAPYKVCVWRIA